MANRSDVFESDQQWVWLKHPNGGLARFPNDPDVLAEMALRDWEPTDEPEDGEPSQTTLKAGSDADWVNMHHRDTGARVRVAADPSVVDDFHKRGWRQDNVADQADDVPEPEFPADRPEPAKKTAAKKAVAQEKE